MSPWGIYTTWLAYKIFYESSIKILKLFWFLSSAKIFYLLIKYTTNKIGDSRIKGGNCVVYQKKKKKMKLWVHILEPWVHVLILITPVIFLNIKLMLWFYTSMKGMELDKKCFLFFSSFHLETFYHDIYSTSIHVSCRIHLSHPNIKIQLGLMERVCVDVCKWVWYWFNLSPRSTDTT